MKKVISDSSPGAESQSKKYLALLGLCRRAGKLEAGFDASVNAVKLKKATLVIAAQDISEKSFKNLRYEAEKEKVPVMRVPDNTESLSGACGKKAGIFAVCDSGFSKAVIGQCKAVQGTSIFCQEQKKEGFADDGKV